MALPITEEMARILYPPWQTEWVRPRPRTEPLREGDEYGAVVARRGAAVVLKEPRRGDGRSEGKGDADAGRVNYTVTYPDGRKEVIRDGARVK